MRQLIAALGLLVALSALPAWAADSGSPAAKRIKLEGFNVDGTVQKPQAFYVLPRTALTYTNPDRPVSFLAKIRKSLDKEPF